MQKRDRQLQQMLEEQSEQIERVFMQHRIPTRVSGGEIREPWIRFDLQTTLAAGRERVESIRRDLMAALGVATVAISGEADQWQVAVRQEEQAPVPLLPLLADLPALPPVTAVLGLAEDGRPLLLDLTAENACHALIAGNAGAGKSALLRTAALSLAHGNRQSRLQMLLLDGDAIQAGGRATPFRPLEYLPHMLNPVIEMADDAEAALAFIDGELAYRLEQEIQMPAIVVMIDNVNAIIKATQGAGMKHLMKIAQAGDQAGIHLLLTTANPGDGALDALFRANIPVRLVGQVDDERAAWAAAGMADSQAEYLTGQGDFLAIAADVMTRFQAAYVRPAELPGVLTQLYRPQRPAILAQPAFDIDEDEEADESQLFVIDDELAGELRFVDGGEADIVDLDDFDLDESLPTGRNNTEPASYPASPLPLTPSVRSTPPPQSGPPQSTPTRSAPTQSGPPAAAAEQIPFETKSRATGANINQERPRPTVPAPQFRFDDEAQVTEVASEQNDSTASDLAGPARPRSRRTGPPVPAPKINSRLHGSGAGAARPSARPAARTSNRPKTSARPAAGQKGRPAFGHKAEPVDKAPEPEYVDEVVYEDLDEEIPFE